MRHLQGSSTQTPAQHLQGLLPVKMKDGSDSRNKVLKDLSVRGRRRLERPLDKPLRRTIHTNPAQGRFYVPTQEQPASARDGPKVESR
jgi:hypothetical protein